MIEDYLPIPVLLVMTLPAIGSQRFAMNILLLMTPITALIFNWRVNIAFMALGALYFLVGTAKGKTCLLMIELVFIPLLIVMAPGTILTVLTLVNIIMLVTTVTGFRYRLFNRTLRLLVTTNASQPTMTTE